MGAIHRPLRCPSRLNRFECSEAGDTLIEILIAIAILGITITALLGALLTTLTSAAEHRTMTSLDTALRSYAEQLKYDVELQPSNAWFSQCALAGPPPVGQTESTYNGNPVTPPSNQPTGYTVVIVGSQIWNGATNAFDPPTPTTNPTQCSSNPNESQSGFQLLTLEATAPNGLTDTLSLGLRQP